MFFLENRQFSAICLSVTIVMFFDEVSLEIMWQSTKRQTDYLK